MTAADFHAMRAEVSWLSALVLANCALVLFQIWVKFRLFDRLTEAVREAARRVRVVETHARLLESDKEKLGRLLEQSTAAAADVKREVQAVPEKTAEKVAERIDAHPH